jgi:hypothetical protein
MIGQIEHLASQFGGEFGTESSAVGVGGFLHSLGVVEHGE